MGITTFPSDSSPGEAGRTVWVKPRVSPEILKHVFPLPLRGSDRVNFEISLTQILPGKLEEERLLRALEDALTFYPHASGRIRQRGGAWTIQPGKRGIPVTFAFVQEPYDHYQYPAEAPPHLLDSVTPDLSGSKNDDWDEPLLKFKVTHCLRTGETYIGHSSSHIIGDGEFVYQFLNAWSQYYQGIPLKFQGPTYEKYKTAPTPECNDNPSTAEFISQYLPHLKTLYPINDWMGMIGQAMTGTETVDLLFTNYQMKQIQQIANEWPGRANVKGHISAQDALAAYIITTLNQCTQVPITRTSNILSYRGVKNPEGLGPDEWRVPGTLAVGNAIFQAFTPPLSPLEATSLGAIAWGIRRSILNARNYAHVKRVVAISDPIWLRQSEEQSEHKFWQGEGGIVLNAFGKLSFPQSHFGFGTEKTRNVMYGAFPGYIRFFAASPVKCADGKSWTSNEGSMWMFVRIPSRIKEKFLATIASELYSPAFPQNLLSRERRILAITAERSHL